MKSSLKIVLILFSSFIQAECVKEWAHLYRGPGSYFGIQWQAKPFTPLKVLSQKGSWKLVEEFDGVKSWIHKDKLTKKYFCGILKQNSWAKLLNKYMKNIKLFYSMTFKIREIGKNWVTFIGNNGQRYRLEREKLWVY